MEEERSKKRNVRPVEKSRLPAVTLLILSVLVLALLYVGYDYLTDEPGDLTEVANTDPEGEVVSLDIYNEPSEVDASNSGPVPVPGGKKPDAKETPAKTETAAKPEEKKATQTATPKDGQIYSHTVASGETLSSIATRYNLTVETVRSLNPSLKTNEAVKAGQKVNVKVKAVHTVGPGDILRVVGQKYGVSVDLIMRANNKSKNHAVRGEKLVIPFSEKI